MSLLEDIFLRDEANEAQELERIIEGEEFEERARSDSDSNSEKEDEAEEDKRRVDPNETKAKRVVRNPRFVLNPARLTGPRGIQVIPEHFKDFKFKGKGHEKEDLDLILKKLEHWAYRLYPKFQFEDCLKKIETLGKKRPVMVHLQKIRSDQLVSDETVVQKDSSDEETPATEPEEDEFDRLLQQQIELARATPAPNSAKKPPPAHSPIENRLVTIPKATSSPSISDEQRERMLRSRQLAEEKRLARLKNNSIESVEPTPSVNQAGINNKADNLKHVAKQINSKDVIEIEDTELRKIRRHNKSNVIDSSDEEDAAVTCVNESITVDIHPNSHEDNSQIDHVKDQEVENIEDIDTINDVEVIECIESDRIVSEKTYDIQNQKEVDNTNINIDKEKITAIEESANGHEKSQEVEDTNTNTDIETMENYKSKQSHEKNENMIENLEKVSKTDHNVDNTDIEEDKNSKSKEQDSTEMCEIMDVDFGEEF